jgi:hypothetical protein
MTRPNRKTRAWGRTYLHEGFVPPKEDLQTSKFRLPVVLVMPTSDRKPPSSIQKSKVSLRY